MIKQRPLTTVQFFNNDFNSSSNLKLKQPAQPTRSLFKGKGGRSPCLPFVPLYKITRKVIGTNATQVEATSKLCTHCNAYQLHHNDRTENQLSIYEFSSLVVTVQRYTCQVLQKSGYQYRANGHHASNNRFSTWRNSIVKRFDTR